MPSHIARVVADTPLFESLSPERQLWAASIFSARTYESGEQVFGPHDADDRTYVIASGAGRVSRVDAEGRCIAVSLLDPGDVFGRAVMSEAAAGERVDTLERTVILRAASGDFERLLEREPRVAVSVVSSLARRLRECEGRLEALAFQQVPARLARALVDLAERYGKVTSGGVRIDVRITHGQLAELVATTRETLTKVAGWLRAEGIATLERRQIWVHDYALLEDVADGRCVMPGRTTRTGSPSDQTGSTRVAVVAPIPDATDLGTMARQMAARRRVVAAGSPPIAQAS
jgi:CRP-like cAMP-binding protein